jgi:DNA-binding transcriptional LysR family regulator
MKWNDRIGRRLKLHDLHVLMAVTEMGSMGKAAERLAVSQPSVSKAISDIEQTVGVRLLDRTSKGVEVTAYGRALLRRGMAAFEELREGIKEIEYLADPTVGEVRVGCPDVFTGGLMSAIIDHFSRQHPRVMVNVVAVNNVTEEFRQLRDRAVDFLLAGFPISYADDDLDVEALYEHRPFIVAGRNCRWAHRRKIDLAELAEEPWLLPREGIFVSLLTEAFRAQGLSIPRFGVRSYSVFHLGRGRVRAPLPLRPVCTQGPAGKPCDSSVACRYRHLEKSHGQPGGAKLSHQRSQNRKVDWKIRVSARTSEFCGEVVHHARRAS